MVLLPEYGVLARTRTSAMGPASGIDPTSNHILRRCLTNKLHIRPAPYNWITHYMANVSNQRGAYTIRKARQMAYFNDALNTYNKSPFRYRERVETRFCHFIGFSVRLTAIGVLTGTQNNSMGLGFITSRANVQPRSHASLLLHH